MGKNTSVVLGDYFERFIQDEIASGKYASASEVIKDALRLLEIQETRTHALRAALIAGEQSGFVDDFDPQQHLDRLKAKSRNA